MADVIIQIASGLSGRKNGRFHVQAPQASASPEDGGGIVPSLENG